MGWLGCVGVIATAVLTCSSLALPYLASLTLPCLCRPTLGNNMCLAHWLSLLAGWIGWVSWVCVWLFSLLAWLVGWIVGGCGCCVVASGVVGWGGLRLG